MSRSTIIGVAALLIVIVGIFVLVDQDDINTKVFSPTPTANPNIWVQTEDGRYTYGDNTSVGLVYQIKTLDQLLADAEIQAPENQNPLIAVLQSMRSGLEDNMGQAGLAVLEETFIGPEVKEYDGVPVALLEIHIEPQTDASGQPFEGLQLVRGYIDQGNGQIVEITAGYNGTYDPMVFDSFYAWLKANASGLLTYVPAPEPTEEPEVSATEEPEAVSTAEPEITATEAPTAAEPEIAATEEPAPPANATWDEVEPGRYFYASDDRYSLSYQIENTDDVIAQYQVVVAEGDEPFMALLTSVQAGWNEFFTSRGFTDVTSQTPVIEDMNGVPVVFWEISVPAQNRTGSPTPDYHIAGALIDQGDEQVASVLYIARSAEDTNAYDAFRAWLSANVELLRTAEPLPDFPGQDIIFVLIDRGNNELTVVQFVSQGTPNQQVFADFDTWLTDNAERLTDANAEVPAPVDGSPWSEITAGSLTYATNPQIQAEYYFWTIDEMITNFQLVPPAADSENPLMDLSEQLKISIETFTLSQALDPALSTILGPEVREYGDVSAVYLRLTNPPQFTATTEPEPTAEPEAASTVEPEPVTTAEPEAVTTAEPEIVVTAEATPDAE